jgi:hypothetical protein
MPTPRISTPEASLTPDRREFVEQGEFAPMRWHVVEMTTVEHAGASQPRCLVFTSHTMMRRVYGYPAHWRTLSDAELLALSWQR